MLTVGCEREGSGPDVATTPTDSIVLVLDLDNVAKAVGRDQAMEQRIESARAQLRERVGEYAAGLQAELERHAANTADDAEEGNRRQLAQAAAQARQALGEAGNRAESEVRRYQAMLVQEFRDQVRPIAERVARRRGGSLVLSARPDALWFQPAVDITDEVIAELRRQPLPEPAPVRVGKGSEVQHRRRRDRRVACTKGRRSSGWGSR